MSQPSSQQHASPQPGQADPDAARFPNPQPVLLKDLPSTPEIQRLMEEHCRRNRRRHVPLHVAEEIKLQYHYQGQEVAITQTPRGRTVLASGTPEEVGRFLDSVPTEERLRITLAFVPDWKSVDV